MTPSDPNPVIRRFALGDYQTNCYVIEPPPHSDAPRSCWIADAGYNPGPLLEHLAAEGLEPEAIVLTHAHLDHIGGLFELRRHFPKLPIWIHEAERDWLTDPMLNLSAFAGMPTTGPEPDRLLQDGERLELAGQAWTVIHTPGHSPGGVALYHEPSGTLIAGDALFRESIGRTDFPSSDHGALVRSIRERLFTLPERTLVLPGHGPETTIGHERAHNHFVQPE